MTLPSSGAISMSDIAVELGYSSSTVIDLTSAEVRQLVGKPTGDIVLPNDFWGKSSLTVSVTITPASNASTSSTLTSGTYTYSCSVVRNGVAHTPSAYLWAYVSMTEGSGSGQVIGSTTGSSATLQCNAFGNNRATARFQCRVTVDGKYFYGYCTKSHTYTGTVN